MKIMQPYFSPMLFHGPTARQSVLGHAVGLGRLISAPIGDDGLNIEEARNLADFLERTPVGDKPGVLIVGPLCAATRGTTDVLLKVLEEFRSDVLRPLLWAHDEADVSPTVRSRCVSRWCPGAESSPDGVDEAAKRAIAASQATSWASLIETLSEHKPKDLLRATARMLAGMEGTNPLWLRIRALLAFREVSAGELLAAFLDSAPAGRGPPRSW